MLAAERVERRSLVRWKLVPEKKKALMVAKRAKADASAPETMGKMSLP
jgi:hypothetical protein